MQVGSQTQPGVQFERWIGQFFQRLSELPSRRKPAGGLLENQWGASLRFAHGFPIEVEAIRTVHQSVQNTVGDRRIPDLLVPTGDWQLAAQYRRPSPISGSCPMVPPRGLELTASSPSAARPQTRSEQMLSVRWMASWPSGGGLISCAVC